MGAITMHPKPAPVKLPRKVVEAIVVEACLDVDWEGMHEDRPEALIATYERIGRDIAYIKVLLSRELTEAWAVLRAQKEIRKEWDRVAEEIGAEVLYMEDDDAERRRVRKKRIKALRKQARRLVAARKECSRFWDECKEHDRDQEAAERLGISTGGEG